MKHKYKSGTYCFIKNTSNPLYFKNLEFNSYTHSFELKKLNYVYVKEINTKIIHLVKLNDLQFYS